jgi:hypothetical protein
MGVNARSILRERRAARSYTGYSHGDIGDIVWTTNDGRVRSFTKGGGTSRTPNQSGGTQHSMAGWSQATSRGLCIQSHGILLSTAAGPSNRRLLVWDQVTITLVLITKGLSASGTIYTFCSQLLGPDQIPLSACYPHPR